MKTYEIELETLSPVCIGNGKKMQHITDYIYSEDNIDYINKDVVAEKLSKDDDLMDKYVNAIAYRTINNQTEFDLANFLEKDAGLNKDEYISYSIGTDIQNEKELNCIIKNANGKPYIPGSSLKGAIRTAILYNYLEKEKESTLFPFLNKVEDEKNWKKNLDNLNNDLDAYFTKNNIFGISDSKLIETEHMKVLDLQRISITPNNAIPQVWESIKPGTKTTFTLRINTQKSNKGFSIESIFKNINTFTENNIKRELEILKNCKANEESNNKIIEEYEGYLDDIKNLPSNEAILRIGFSKGFYFNSIAELLYQYDFEEKEVFTEYIKSIYKKVEDSNFPKTRNITKDQNQLGWVKLKIN